MLVLTARLTERPEPTRRFLRAALGAEPVTLASLLAAQVPHYDAVDYLRRLETAGELRAGAWVNEAREGYSLLLSDRPTTPVIALPEPPVSRALERLAEGERPREKALRSGIDALDDAELLALLLRTGPGEEGVLAFAQRLLHEHGGLVELARLDVSQLTEAHGLGPAKAAEMAAAFELGRRLSHAALRARPIIKTPEDVVALLTPMMVGLMHEELWCLPLDSRDRLIGLPRVVSRGDVDGTDGGPRAFFRAAISAGAVAALAVHNHPTGNPNPSRADLDITRRLVLAGRTVDIFLSDHLVLFGEGGFTSLRRVDPDLFR